MPAHPAQIDATIEIVTPENIAFSYRVAGPFHRLPAYLIDLFLRLLLMFVLAVLASLFAIVSGGLSLAAWLVGFFVLSWFYGGLFEAFWNGRTPGKWLVGIRVLSTNGRPISGYQAVLRHLLLTVDMGPFISLAAFGAAPYPLLPTYLIGLATMACNRRFQRLGDLVCQTMVVVEERPWLGGLARIEDPRAFQLASYLPSNLRVSRSLARALSHYAERRRYFSPARRREVAAHIARPLLQQYRLPSNTSYDLLLCAMYYRLFVADRGADERHVAQAQAAARLHSANGV